MHKNMVIFGTRPEAIKLFPVVNALAGCSDMRTEVLVSAQHRQMLDQVLAISGIVPNYDLDLMQPGQSLDALTARLLGAIGGVLDTAKPDRVIVQGDTATAMARRSEPQDYRRNCGSAFRADRFFCGCACRRGRFPRKHIRYRQHGD